MHLKEVCELEAIHYVYNFLNNFLYAKCKATFFYLVFIT